MVREQVFEMYPGFRRLRLREFQGEAVPGKYVVWILAQTLSQEIESIRAFHFVSASLRFILITMGGDSASRKILERLASLLAESGCIPPDARIVYVTQPN